jgi:hypothetical protein
MTGYQLIEDDYLRPHRAKGIVPATEVIGIFDFLRELEEDPLPFAKYAQLRIVGIEEVLFAARPNDHEIAIEIHTKLNRAAADLERKLMDIQVIITGKIVRGADMTVEYRGATLPISVIFNHPQPRQDAHGNVSYPIEFHLSSP